MCCDVNRRSPFQIAQNSKNDFCPRDAAHASTLGTLRRTGALVIVVLVLVIVIVVVEVVLVVEVVVVVVVVVIVVVIIIH